MADPHRMSLLVPEDLMNEVKKIASITERKWSFVVRKILEYYINSEIDIFELDKWQKKGVDSKENIPPRVAKNG